MASIKSKLKARVRALEAERDQLRDRLAANVTSPDECADPEMQGIEEVIGLTQQLEAARDATARAEAQMNELLRERDKAMQHAAEMEGRYAELSACAAKQDALAQTLARLHTELAALRAARTTDNRLLHDAIAARLDTFIETVELLDQVGADDGDDAHRLEALVVQVADLKASIDELNLPVADIDDNESAVDHGATVAHLERELETVQQTLNRREAEWYDERRLLQEHAEALHRDRSHLLSLADISVQQMEDRLAHLRSELESTQPAADARKAGHVCNELERYLVALGCMVEGRQPGRKGPQRVFNPESVVREIVMDVCSHPDIEATADVHVASDVPEFVRSDLPRFQTAAFFLIRRAVVACEAGACVSVELAFADEDAPESAGRELSLTIITPGCTGTARDGDSSSRPADVDLTIAQQLAVDGTFDCERTPGPGGSDRAVLRCAASAAGDDPEDARMHVRLNVDGLTCEFGTLKDLSLGGARIVCRRPPDPCGSIVVAGESASIELRYERVWQRRTGFRKHEVGLRFLHMTEEQYRRMVTIAMASRDRRVLDRGVSAE